MTVAELIESLRSLPGDADLRCVIVRMTLRRPYAPDTTIEGSSIFNVSISHDVANLDCFGYVE